MAKTSVWKVTGENKYYKQINETKWAEVENGRVKNKYKLLSKSNDVISLVNKSDGSILRLDSQKVSWASSFDPLYQQGEWVELVWTKKCEQKYFMQLSDTEWAEFVNGSQCHTFKFVSRAKDEVILQKSDGNYVKLNSNEIRMGRTQDTADLTHLYYGSWNNPNSYNFWRMSEDLCFKKISHDHYGEFQNGIKVFDFKLLENTNNYVRLKKSDGSFVELSPKEIRIGQSLTQMKHLYSGEWKVLVTFAQMNFDSKYFKEKSRGIYIKKLSGNNWIEQESNGKVTKYLEYLGRLDDHVVLFNRADGNVIKVYSNQVKHSRSWYFTLHEGGWVKEDKKIECLNLIQIILRIGIFLSQMIGLVLVNFIFDQKCNDECMKKFEYFNIVAFVLIAGLGALFSAFIFIIDLIYWLVINKTESTKRIVIVIKTLIVDLLWLVAFVVWISINSKLSLIHQMNDTDKTSIKRDYLITAIVFGFIATVLSVVNLAICFYRVVKCLQKINQSRKNRRSAT